jgi:endonuclease/exonuclease/phosphatase family metal-dependent hydrolase
MFCILIVIVLFIPILLSEQVLFQLSDVHHVASFNIHYIVPNDKYYDWERRKHAVTNILIEMDADIVAFQEMETFDGGHYSKRNIQLDCGDRV